MYLIRRAEHQSACVFVHLSVSINTSSFRDLVAKHQVCPMPKLLLFPLYCTVSHRYDTLLYRKHKYIYEESISVR